jgi:nucleoside-diphosphate-sugar epimerase
MIGIWGSGLIGRSLAKALVERGISVRLLSRSGNRTTSFTAPLTQFGQMSLSASKEEMRSALDGVSVLVHCAGSVDDEQKEYESAAVKLGEVAREVGLNRLVLLSTVAVYGDALESVGLKAGTIVTKSLEPLPNSPYAKSRDRAERLLEESLDRTGIGFSIVRVPMVLGFGMKANLFMKLRRLLDLGLFPISSSRSASLPCIRVERLVQGLTHLVIGSTRPQRLYQFAEYLRWVTIQESFEEAKGRRVHAIPIPAGLVIPACRALGNRVVGPVLRVLLNEAVYQDDLLGLLSEAGPSSLDDFGHCRPSEIRPDASLRDILWP